MPAAEYAGPDIDVGRQLAVGQQQQHLVAILQQLEGGFRAALPGERQEMRRLDPEDRTGKTLTAFHCEVFLRRTAGLRAELAMKELQGDLATYEKLHFSFCQPLSALLRLRQIGPHPLDGTA